MTDRQLQGPSVVRVLRNVYRPAELDLTLELLADAALAALPLSSAISGELAVALWGLPRPLRRHLRDTDPLLSAPTTCSLGAADARRDNRSTLDIAEVHLPREHIRVRNGRRLVAPARLFVDLAAEWSLEDLVALGDAMLCKKIVTAEELTKAVVWAKRRRGVVRARTALALLDGHSESAMESRLRLIVLATDLPRPAVNKNVYDGHGGFVARPDLQYAEFKVAVEYDGIDHASSRRRSADEARRHLLRRHGWVVLTFTSDEVLDRPWVVVERVREELVGRGWTMPTAAS
jgi:hypothetical protein